MQTPVQVSAAQAAQDYLIAHNDAAEFIDRFCLIKDENKGTVSRFRLWDYQREILREWVTERLVVDLKARQLGISWLVCAFALWLINFYDDVTVLCISATQDKAFDLINKVKFMYDNLPPYLKKPIIKRNNASLQFAGEGEAEQGSRIMALASTPGAAVGYTATLVIVDEWGEQGYAEELYSSFKPTIDMGGRLIGIGTGNAVGSFYHEICTQAQAGENGFKFRFLGWWLRPGRHKIVDGVITPDLEWYEDTRRGYPNLQEFLRMYPSTPLEAFIAAGGCPFSIEDLQWYEEVHVRDPLKWQYLEDTGWPEKLVNAAKIGDLQVWEKPQAGYPYLVYMDPATGKEDGGDYHAIQVIKTSNMEQVAEVQTRCDTDLATDLGITLSNWYNNEMFAWESTGVGHAVTNVVVRNNYPNIYEHREFSEDRAARRQRIKQKDDRRARLGWPARRTTNAARGVEIIGAIRDRSVIIHSARWLNEAKGFVRQPDGSYGASGRAHDDLVVSLATGLHIAIRRATRVQRKAKPTVSYKKRTFRRDRWS
jgi:hypothetical protein